MSAATWQAEKRDGLLCVHISGNWTITTPSVPPLEPLLAQLDNSVAHVMFEVSGLQAWDSLLVSKVLVLLRACQQRGIVLDQSTLPVGMPALLALATAVPPEPVQPVVMMGFAESVQDYLGRQWSGVRAGLVFGGELILAFMCFFTGRAHVRARDCWFFIEQAGPGALGIISLISVLAGVILAYLGAVQLRQFGAQMYVANLVSIGMTREMGALMTAIIMAGRTGAAYAAQLGTMQANEEIDALHIMGIRAIDFLVVPRVLALVLVLPLLTVYADMLGIAGGSLIAGSMDIGFTQYLTQVQGALSTRQIFAGLFKSVVFAVLIAQAGCYWGFRSGRSSNDVGIATTRAVVTALVAIIVADSLVNVIYNRLGI